MPLIRDDAEPDIFLTHSGGTMGFFLYEDPQQPSVRMWEPSYLPETAQQIQQGVLSYDDRPKNVSQAITFEDWSGGAALSEATPGTARPTTYSYSRGVDASWTHPCISPQMTAMVGIASAVTKFYHSPSFGDFALTAGAVYHLAAGQWVNVYTPGAAPTDLIEYVNSTAAYLFLAMGDSTSFVYTTDTFATTTAVVEQATYFVVRGSTSLQPVLFATKTNGAVRSSVNPILSANWSNEDQIGSRGETVTSLVLANDLMWFMKDSGFYTFDGTTIGSLVDVSQLARPTNGTKTLVWVNGFIISNYGDRVLMINPYTLETFGLYTSANAELNGTITALAADLKYLYVFQQNAAGDTYVLKGDILSAALAAANNGVFHTIAYLPAVTVAAAMVLAAGPQSPSTTNPVLLVSTATAVDYSILARTGYQPWEDANYRFDVNGGSIYSPWVDGGAQSVPKWVSAMRIVGRSLSAAQSVVGSFSTEGDASTVTALTTATADGLTNTNEANEYLFTRIQSVFTLSTGDNRHTPIFVGGIIDCTPNPPRHHMWTLMLDLGDQQRTRSGGDKRPIAFRRMYSHLQAAIGSRVTYEDYFGTTYIVKVLNVSLNGVKRNATGQGRSQVVSTAQLTMAEVSANAIVDDPFVWNQSSYDAGYEWSA